MKADVYFNLHKKLWSVRRMDTRKVIQHCSELMMCDVKFNVSEKGRLRVNKEKRKNVHAYARGIVLDKIPSKINQWLIDAKFKEAYYNPYKVKVFVDKVTKKPLAGKYIVYMRASDKTVWYKDQSSILH